MGCFLEGSPQLSGAPGAGPAAWTWGALAPGRAQRACGEAQSGVWRKAAPVRAEQIPGDTSGLHAPRGGLGAPSGRGEGGRSVQASEDERPTWDAAYTPVGCRARPVPLPTAFPKAGEKEATVAGWGWGALRCFRALLRSLRAPRASGPAAWERPFLEAGVGVGVGLRCKQMRMTSGIPVP